MMVRNVFSSEELSWAHEIEMIMVQSMRRRSSIVSSSSSYSEWMLDTIIHSNDQVHLMVSWIHGGVMLSCDICVLDDFHLPHQTL